MIQIQATIVGYGDLPATLFSSYDDEREVLAIAVEAEYREERREGAIVVANDERLDRDSLFSDEHLREAIAAYFAMQKGVARGEAGSRLIFRDRAQRAVPSVENDGYDESGPKWRVSPNIANVQVAALATAWYVKTRLLAVSGLAESAKTLMNVEHIAEKLERGHIVSI
jgi:hypothetical protein